MEMFFDAREDSMMINCDDACMFIAVAMRLIWGFNALLVTLVQFGRERWRIACLFFIFLNRW